MLQPFAIHFFQGVKPSRKTERDWRETEREAGMVGTRIIFLGSFASFSKCFALGRKKKQGNKLVNTAQNMEHKLPNDTETDKNKKRNTNANSGDRRNKEKEACCTS